MTVASKSDRDRLRERAGTAARRRKRIEVTVDRIIREHLEQGRPARACMADLIAAAKGQQETRKPE